MDALAPFRIPLSALQADSASFKWDIGPDFFLLFDGEHKPPGGHFSVGLEIERTGGVSVLDFEVKGKIETACDRCNVPIGLPVEGDFEIVAKLGNPAESSEEVIFIDPEAPELNVGKTIYDLILISIPISHRIPGCDIMEQPPCDMSIINYLSENHVEEVPPKELNPLWDELKKAIDN